MNKAVLDASAILAALFDEPGAEKLTDEVTDNAVVSSVNLAEVQAKLIKKGYEPSEAWEDALSVATAEHFTPNQARIAGTLIEKTGRLGLSLGDRSCLALAIDLRGEVYTADQAWRGLKLGIPIHVIR